MHLEERKALLVRLGEYMLANGAPWQLAKNQAQAENGWFIPEFVQLSIESVATQYLAPESLNLLITGYQISPLNKAPKKVGIVMAGNIPLVGFHDFLCVFLSGHISVIKPSSKDDVLIRHLVATLQDWEPKVSQHVYFGELLKNCDAYIATGSNNSGRYFEYYFEKYPHIIRKNRTSLAVLKGEETTGELQLLADDCYQYFGLGCRNVTKIFVPLNYDFVPLLEAFRKYDHLSNHNKYKNNYDYQLAIHLLNNKYYMTNGSILLIEEASVFSPISQLNYEYYSDLSEVRKKFHDNAAIQCVVGDDSTGFGQAQKPGVCEFADDVDTMAFLAGLA